MTATIANLFFLIAQEAASGPGSYMLIIYIVLFVGIFYFLLIRPGQKQRKAHDQLVSTVKKGDTIMTAGGVFGTITQIKEDYLMLEIARKTEVKLSRNSIARVFSRDETVAMENQPEEISGEEDT